MQKHHRPIQPHKSLQQASLLILSVKLQAGHADPPVSARQSTSVPIKLLHSSQSSRYTVAPMLRCTSSADRTVPRHRLSTYDVQCSARRSTIARSQHSNLQTITEDTPFRCLSARLAH